MKRRQIMQGNFMVPMSSFIRNAFVIILVHVVGIWQINVWRSGLEGFQDFKKQFSKPIQNSTVTSLKE